MVEPVPATRSVRRTVRVAVALVIGQALLCALIGWITFTYSPAHRDHQSPAVDQMAGAPVVAPRAGATSATALAAPSSSAPAGKRAKHDAGAADPAAPSTAQSSAVPGVVLNVPAFPAVPMPTATSENPQLTVLPPQPPAPASTTPSATTPPATAPAALPSPEVVVPGTECDHENAVGHTVTGAEVHCLRNRHRQLRWKIV
jgi:hypothetical protein